MNADLWADATAHLRGLYAEFALAPGEAARVIEALSASLASGALVRAFTFGLILLVVGAGLEWLYWNSAAAALRTARARRPANRRAAARRAGRVLALRASGVAVFAGSVIGAAAILPWPSGVGAAAAAVAAVVGAARAGAVLGAFLLAWPIAARDLGAGRSPRLPAAVAGAAAGAAAAAALLPGVLIHLVDAPDLAEVLRVACAAPVTVAALWGSARLGRPSSGGGAGRPRLPPAAPMGAAIAACAFAWLAGAGLATALIVDAGLVALLLVGSRPALAPLWAERPAEGWTTLAAPLALAASRFAVVMLGLAAARPLLAAAGRDGQAALAAELVPRILDVTALALVTSLLWTALSTGVSLRLSRIDKGDGGAAAGPDGRLLTLLPLLRTAGGVALALGFTLSALWALDVPIAPLLAGAGVFGIALGFGAQTLVRDIISGVFYLAEDVFRIGEYIEADAHSKGTVERITLRTVALRHPDGPLHFVPYGALGTVRNGSRDWVIDKFDLPLPVGVDSERIRRLVKGVGLEMLEDEALAELMHAPLKARLGRIAPGVKVFRCKFRTLPGQQFAIRAEAYRRIEAALAEAGLAFADPGQTTVLVRRPDPVDPA